MAGTLKAQRGKGGGGIGPEETLVPTLAATLSSGGHPNSNMPGRRNEDDVNLVVKRGPTWEESLATAFHLTQDPISGDIAHAMGTESTVGVAHGAGVRRLTPTECERLQGFPDDWTQIPWNGKPSPDSRRYAALGNAVTVNVAHWIGHRIVAS